MVVAALFAANSFAAAGRFQPLDQVAGPAAEWISVSAGQVALGSGNAVYLGTFGTVLRLDLSVALRYPVSDGALLGGRLFLVERGTRLMELDLESQESSLRPVSLAFPTRGRVRLAVRHPFLFVADDEAVRTLRLPPAAGGMHRREAVHAAGNALELVDTMPLPGPITAMAASPTMLFAAVEGGDLVGMSLESTSPFRAVRPLPRRNRVEALLHDGVRLFLLMEEGLHLLDGVGGSESVHPEVRGTALWAAGRTIYVAAGEGGIQSFRDESANLQLFSVGVFNNFFSPAALDINVGDSVRWTNASGLHNVQSCTPGQTGCTVASSEFFLSGVPADPLWIYTFTFAAPGQNPYICFSHAAFMRGLVTVGGPFPAPPAVPSGAAGPPMTVEAIDAAGSTLLVHWDTGTCSASEHQILFGGGSSLPDSLGGVFGPVQSRCSVGVSGSFLWDSSPDPASDATGLIWWLVVATEGELLEGSWGTGSDGLERRGTGNNGSSGECGLFTKDLTNACGSP